MSAKARYNVNYVSKFRLSPDDGFEADVDRLTVRDGRHPSLHAVTATRPAWSALEVALEHPATTGHAADGSESGVADLGVVTATWVNTIVVASASGMIHTARNMPTAEMLIATPRSHCSGSRGRRSAASPSLRASRTASSTVPAT